MTKDVAFNATFNNILVLSWRSVVLVDETGVPGENHRPAASHWYTLSHNVTLSKPGLSEIRTDNRSGDKLWFFFILWQAINYIANLFYIWKDVKSGFDLKIDLKSVTYHYCALFINMLLISAVQRSIASMPVWYIFFFFHL